MSTLQNLLKARALIETPEKWTQNAFARNKHGRIVDGYAITATCFCTYGAVAIACGSSMSNAASATAKALQAQLSPRHIALPQFNDDPRTTHADILNLFDKAIEHERLNHS